MAILGPLVNGQAQLFADGLGLQHHGADKTPHQVVVQYAAGALFVAVGVDTMLLASAAQDLLARFRADAVGAPQRPAGY